MDKSILGTNVVVQVGIVVNDIEAASSAWADFFGVEKPQWRLTDEPEKTHIQYRGAPGKARAKLAFFDAGAINIELIEPNSEPSTWREHLDTYGEGVHHIAFIVKGMKEKIIALENKNFNLIQKGEYKGGRYAYMDTLKDLKVILELLEND